MGISDLDEIRVLWHTIAELQLDIQPADTGHIRTTINTLLDHVRAKEKNLGDIDRTALELIAPNRWEHDWCAVI
jgi:hypothetical protein